MVAVTGIERLRGYARRMDELHVWPGGARLREIAEQIELELVRQDEPDSTDNGPSPSPVTDEERDAGAWVRDHGGLDHVKEEWRSRVPYNRHERARQRLLDHIAECETALGRRNVRIEELGRRVGDLTTENAELRKLGERVKRPAVLAADGEPLEVGETVWHVTTGHEYIVRSCTNGGAHLSRDGRPAGYCRAEYLTHQRPVLDADGVPIKKGDTVYLLPGEWCDEFPCLGFHGGEELEVFDDGEAIHVSGSVQCREKEKKVGFRSICYPQPSQLTHTKPEPPKRLCRDCRHWQGDPSASHMGVCFNSYRERCCVDSYAAQLDYAEACEDFEGRGE